MFIKNAKSKTMAVEFYLFIIYIQFYYIHKSLSQFIYQELFYYFVVIQSFLNAF